MSTTQLLRQFAFLSPFGDEQLEWIANSATRTRMPPGASVIRIGDPSGSMYLILQGEVQVHRYDENGDEVILGKLDTGKVFGELALLSGEARMASITTLTECEFLVIDRSLLLETVSRATPDAILKLFAVLSNQIRTTNEREFQEMLSKRMLAVEMEAERQRGLTQMVAGVAHELNTPLGVINTAASIIERELARPAFKAMAEKNEDERQTLEDIHEAIGLIQGNINRAHHLVQDFKKVSVSQLSDVKEPMLISDAVFETVNLAKAHLKRSGLIINVTDQIPAEHKRWVGYRGYLAQVVLNLLTNIERYAYPTGTGGVADITLSYEDDRFTVAVRDYGKGMSEEVRSRIFEPFFTTGRATGGTGLGMAIVHNLVTTALKGNIHIASTPGQGTEVSVTFPCVIPD